VDAETLLDLCVGCRDTFFEFENLSGDFSDDARSHLLGGQARCLCLGQASNNERGG
jgi:hypothetical protein